MIPRVLLSAFLIFHVTAILVLPNPESIIFRRVEKIFVNYGNLLGINTTWRFFSPNPLIRMFEYEVVENDAYAEYAVEVERHRWPASVEAVGTREGFNRRLSYAMIMMANQLYLREILAPYLCRFHPLAKALNFYAVHREFPSVEKAQTYVSGREDLEKMDRMGLGEYPCGEEGEP